MGTQSQVDAATKRRNKRVRRDVEVSLRSRDCFFSGVCQNMSTGGVFVATSAPLPIGREVEVMIRIDDVILPTALITQVVWIREDNDNGLEPGMGLRFSWVPPDVAMRIQRYVDSSEQQTLLYEI